MVEGWTVSPRKSRRKSACFSSTTTSTPARASRKPSISPQGPPPTTQQRVETCSAIRGSSAIEKRQARRARRCARSGNRGSDSDHPLGDDVAGEQKTAESDDDDGGAD